MSLRPLLVLPLFVGLLLSACNSPQGRPIHRIASEINATLAPIDESIVPGDTLEVTFTDFAAVKGSERPNPSGSFYVPLDGRVQLPGIGVLRVAGRSPAQLAELITEAYRPVYGTLPPAVSVSFQEQAPRTYHVIGAVKSGEYPLDADGRVTLVEALARAGGPTYLVSYMGNVLLVRWDATRQKQVSWVIDARPKWWGEEDTILLQPDDLVFVPQTTIANINDWMERYIIRMIPFPRFFVPAA